MKRDYLKHLGFTTQTICMSKEVWKDIGGYEGLYQISNSGRIKSLIKSKIINGSNKHGYRAVLLWKNGVKKSKYIHRLMAMAFINNNENKPFINHKDGDRSNNNIDNIEWCTPSENTQHAYDNGQIKKQYKKISKVDPSSGEILQSYPSIKAASWDLRIAESAICRALRGVREKAKGFKWIYSNQGQ